LLITIEDLKGSKSLYLARSKNGSRFTVDSKPFIAPVKDELGYMYEDRGVLTSKITHLEGRYYITYTASSHYGARLALAVTDDFKTVEKLGFISEPDTKGGTLFPEKINGRYARLEMPENGGRIWISYSDDLVYWGGFDEIMSPRGGYWDFHKIGPAAPPIKMDNGQWLLLYYGVKYTSAGPLSRIGAAFLSQEDPARVVARTNVPIISPQTMYERVGDIPNLIFVCGAICEKDKLRIYYGAAQSCICLGFASVDEIIENCIASKKDF